ncbi:MAG: CDP-alcohol phosphatidyltransferase family protein [Halodesulfurarchaeum sp.]
MTLDRFRTTADRLLDPVVQVADRLGLSPNAVSVVAFLAAIAAAAAFAVADSGRGWYLLGAFLVLANGYLDLVDGALARAQGHDSKAGDLLDHVLDRYADILIIAGLAAGVDAYAIGLAAVTGVLMTSYLGTQAQAVGLDRVYAGVLGRADRLALVTVVAVLAALLGDIRGVDPVVAVLAVFAVVGHLTAVQRFVGAWRALE